MTQKEHSRQLSNSQRPLQVLPIQLPTQLHPPLRLVEGLQHLQHRHLVAVRQHSDSLLRQHLVSQHSDNKQNLLVLLLLAHLQGLLSAPQLQLQRSDSLSLEPAQINPPSEAVHLVNHPLVSVPPLQAPLSAHRLLDRPLVRRRLVEEEVVVVLRHLQLSQRTNLHLANLDLVL
jgi:hypothetical protein